MLVAYRRSLVSLIERVMRDLDWKSLLLFKVCAQQRHASPLELKMSAHCGRTLLTA